MHLPIKESLMPSEVENESIAKNITLLFDKSAESKFMTGISFGGAGGLGAVVITPNNASDFFRDLEAYKCNIVEVTLFGSSWGAMKKYSALIPNTAGVIEYLVGVPTPDGFEIKDITYKKAVFKQSPSWGWLFLTLLILFLIWAYLCLGDEIGFPMGKDCKK